tara:strand:+ start:287 stop:532 length:246 start_codon:yes stop_codon:yes gene_type:complete
MSKKETMKELIQLELQRAKKRRLEQVSREAKIYNLCAEEALDIAGVVLWAIHQMPEFVEEQETLSNVIGMLESVEDRMPFG